MRIFLGLTIALALGAAAPVASQDAADDLKRMQGRWVCESAVENGTPFPAEALKSIKVVVKGDKMFYEDDERKREGTIKLDPGKNPKQITLTPSDGSKPFNGIYSLEGGKLKTCGGNPGDDRPREFGSAPGSRMMLMVLTRDQRK